MFHCEGNALAHVAVGFHDGIDSWTIALETGLTPRMQAFVGLHERAHHKLHSSTPWGLAMLLSGLPSPGGSPAEAAWANLAVRCRVTHECYATWMAVTQAAGGIEFLRGNLVYLGYYARSHRLAELVGDMQRPGIAVEVLSLAAMAPADLTTLELDGLRSCTATPKEGPDQRLATILDRVEQDDQAAWAVKRALRVEQVDSGDLFWDQLCDLLGELGVETAAAAQQRAWARAMVADFDSMWDQAGGPGRRRVLLEDATAPKDQLTALVDTHQRERLRLQTQPLELHVVDVSTSSLRDFVRLGEGGRPFVVLSWLHTGFLRRQFTGVPAGDRLITCLLSVDRRLGPGHALVMEISDSPAEACAVLAPAVATVRFTTLRTLEATDDEVDFRGWEPAFVLIDSDVLAFLERTSEDPDGAVWSVIDVGRDRHIDVVTLRRRANPSVVHLLPCSGPMGRMVGSWMNERDAFTQDCAAFEDVAEQTFNLLRFLTGALWVFDLHGWAQPAAPGLR